MEAREHIKKEEKDGKSIKELIEKQKGVFTAGKAFSAGLVRIGQTVFDQVTKHSEDMKKKAQEKSRAAQLAMAGMTAKANEVKALGKSPNQLTVAQIKILLAPLKRKGDSALPTKKDELLTRLKEWENRAPLMAVVPNEAAMEPESRTNEDKDSEDEADYFGAVESI